MRPNAFMRVLIVLALMLHGGLAFAQQRQFNDWTVSVSNSGPYAATAEQHGALILYQVPGPRYLWMLEQTGLTCRDQSTLRVRITTDAASETTDVLCLQGQNAQFLFKDFALLTQMLQHASRVRIDLPVENGAPYSAQFSLRGMPDAVSYLRALATPPTQAPGPGGGISGTFQCQQDWASYHQCQEDFKRCTVRTHGTGPCPLCTIPNCTQ
jgi:hypothetical protein